MKLIGVLCTAGLAIGMATAASAQCLWCYASTFPPFNQGVCDESTNGYTTETCQYADIGQVCPRPDFIIDCFSGVAQKHPTIMRLEPQPDRYFGSPLLPRRAELVLLRRIGPLPCRASTLM